MEIFFVELMRFRVVVGLVILLVLLLLVSWVARQPPGKPRLYLVQAGIVTALIALMVLVMTGQLHWAFALLGGLLPAAVRTVQVASATRVARRPRSRRHSSSKVGGNAKKGNRVSSGRRGKRKETRYLRVFTDGATGEMRGKVLKGTFASAHLSELTHEQLRQLHKKYSEQDAESAALLSAYLDQAEGGAQEEVPGSGPRVHANADAGAKESAQNPGENAGAGDSGRRRGKGNGMTHQEAYEILGLKTGADAQAVTDAHRRLMQKMHPDRGGTNYLAAKINQAKDLLLGQMAR